MKPGKLHVYTGDGKGKTTSCIGLAVRAVGAGKRVIIIQFDKGFDGKNEHYSERKVLRTLGGLRLEPTGLERIKPDGTFRFGVLPGDVEEATRGLGLAARAAASAEFDLVILDEILSAQQYHLISENDLLNVIERWEAAGRPCELVLSGRTRLKSVVERADLVTEMKKVKHYFDQGLEAREGIEF